MVGYLKEGYRAHQIPQLFGGIGVGPLVILDQSGFWQMIFLFLLGLNTFALIVYGESDFS